MTVEEERAADGQSHPVATIFLTGRECPWRCAMCDLWKHTTLADTPLGAIPAQVAAARVALDRRQIAVRCLKLYNSGSFFDPGAVPERDYDAVADRLANLDRVVVESHPALVGPRVGRFLDALDRHPRGAPPVTLEVAMGLETAHAAALERLHKRMTVDDFHHASRTLERHGVALRVFLLISPPFVTASQQDEWLQRSIDVAWACGAAVISLVPTRPGNGTLESLAEGNEFSPPRLRDIERSLEAALTHAGRRGRVFVDLWDLERFADCRHCLPARRARLHAMNLEQRVHPRIPCGRCDADTAS